MSKTYDEFTSTIKRTNIKPSYYYTDYQRVATHIENFKDVITKLGVVSSSSEFIERFRDIYNKKESSIEVTTLFTGVRPDKMVVLSDDGNYVEKFNSDNVNFDEAIKFLDEVGFLERVDQYSPLDLPSYFFGVNVGLDSNGRKNRGGYQMEHLVGSYIKHHFNPNEFLEQANYKDVNRKFQTIFTQNEKKVKKYDFVIHTNDKYYFIETNFFNASGSKTDINTRFINLERKTKELGDNVVFILITDGQGLLSALTELEDVINDIEHVYNIDDMEKGLFEKLKMNKI